MRKKRKVIQIEGASAGVGNDFAHVLYALCDDGTIWHQDEATDWKWKPVQDVQQPGPLPDPFEGIGGEAGGEGT